MQTICTSEYDILCDVVNFIKKKFLVFFSGGTVHLYPHHSSLVAPGTPGLLPKGLWDRARTRIAAPYCIPPAASVLRPAPVGNATTPVLHK